MASVQAGLCWVSRAAPGPAAMSFSPGPTFAVIRLIQIQGFDIPDVREVFERSNQEGKDLKFLDIMIARSFQNYDCLVEDEFRR
ncbi:MAG: hypothetical protein J7M32_02300 [Deltaproteobacteria bacterium]|nr:hypothetical protein [Deltaproteobacteria bacterium]